MRCWPSPSHKSMNPSEARMRNLGSAVEGWGGDGDREADQKRLRAILEGVLGAVPAGVVEGSVVSSRRWMICGSAVI